MSAAGFHCFDLRVRFWENYHLFDTTYKIPHSKNRNPNILLGSGVNRCTCGQTFKSRTERDFNMKLKVCPDPPEGISKFEVPRKYTTYEDSLKHETEQYRKLYN